MMLNKLNLIQKRYDDINNLMSQPEILNDLRYLQELGKEKSDLDNIVDMYNKYKACSVQFDDMTEFLQEINEADMTVLIKQELEQLQQKMV